MRIGIVAGESSGDQLGAALIVALRVLAPALTVEGIAGPRMLAAGCTPLASVAELSVMGLVEVLRHYPRLHRLRERVFNHFQQAPPDIFIGIDVPDFVLNIEERLRREGIPTVHYVCPQVWAWRAKRIPQIARAVDLLLAVLPFEVEFFKRHGIPVRFVGHPLADTLPRELTPAAAAAVLGLDASKPQIALLPGSRRQELARHVDLFLLTAVALARHRPDLEFIFAAIDEEAADYIRARQGVHAPALTLRVFTGCVPQILALAQVAVAASGTITLEAALLETPLVVAYKLAPLSYYIMKKKVNVPYIALPNLIANAALAPEFIQDQATPDNLSRAALTWLASPVAVQRYREACATLRDQLSHNAAAEAARAIVRLYESRGHTTEPASNA